LRSGIGAGAGFYVVATDNLQASEHMTCLPPGIEPAMQGKTREQTEPGIAGNPVSRFHCICTTPWGDESFDPEQKLFRTKRLPNEI
jgi:hypothetical protein